MIRHGNSQDMAILDLYIVSDNIIIIIWFIGDSIPFLWIHDDLPLS